MEISRIKKSELESLASQFEKLVDKKENVNKNSNKRNNFMNVAADHQSGKFQKKYFSSFGLVCVM